MNAVAKEKVPTLPPVAVKPPPARQLEPATLPPRPSIPPDPSARLNLKDIGRQVWMWEIRGTELWPNPAVLIEPCRTGGWTVQVFKANMMPVTRQQVNLSDIPKALCFTLDLTHWPRHQEPVLSTDDYKAKQTVLVAKASEEAKAAKLAEAEAKAKAEAARIMAEASAPTVAAQSLSAT